mgnify:CR=1 FL=1
MKAADLDGLQELLWFFARHRVVTVASRTGVLGRLARSPATPAEVADELDLDPLAAGKVIRALAALGLVSAEGRAYRVVETLAPHFSNGDRDLRPFLEHAHRLYDSWGENLEPWLRGGEWGTRVRTPEEVRAFGEAMRAMGLQTARKVSTSLDLDGARRLLDVGGGHGQVSRVLCDRWPDLEAVVLDRPEVADEGRRVLTGSGLEDRISFVGGDYHVGSDYGSGFDVVLFVSVLHQEVDESAAAMVRHAAAALADGGRVIVVDFRIDPEQREEVLGCLFAINMRSFGDTHPEPRIRGWLEAAGLREMTRTDIDPHRWIIAGTKP